MTLPGPDEWPVADPFDGGTPDPDLLAARARATPDGLAVVDADRGDQSTYAALDERVSDRAEWLSGIRLAEGQGQGRIGLLLGTGTAFVELYFAASRCGAPVVPFNLRLDADTLASQSARAGLAAIVTDEETEKTAREIAPAGVPVVPVDDAGPGIDEDRTVAKWRETPGTENERLVVFTSGTTGTPKGVRLTDRNLIASAVGSAFRLDVEPDDRWLAPLPMYHVGGLAPLIRSTLYGTTTVLQREFDPGDTAAAVERADVTGLSLVPTMLTRLLDDGWNPPESLRFVLLGGAPASEELIERASSRGVPVYPTYGLTETASQVTTATPEEARDYPGTVGRPLRTTEVTVVSESGNRPRDRGETGEIVVDGPTVSPGYLDAERTAEAFGEYGLRTGDLGYRDRGGRLWVVGRVDDRIVTGGENVAPARVADAIRALDGVEDAAVVGLPDEEWGERVAALVVGPASLTPEAVRGGVRGSLAGFEVPKTVGFADALPRTPSGTVDRAAVRERLRGAQ